MKSAGKSIIQRLGLQLNLHMTEARLTVVNYLLKSRARTGWPQGVGRACRCRNWSKKHPPWIDGDAFLLCVHCTTPCKSTPEWSKSRGVHASRSCPARKSRHKYDRYRTVLPPKHRDFVNGHWCRNSSRRKYGIGYIWAMYVCFRTCGFSEVTQQVHGIDVTWWQLE